MEIIDGTLKESLHLRCVEVDRDDVLNAGDAHQICKETGGDGSSMRLLLGLAIIREIGDDS